MKRVIIMMWNYEGNHIYLLGFGILVIIAILVANDANNSGRNGLLWGLVTLFMPMMGLFVYLVVRSLPVQTPVVGATPVTVGAPAPAQWPTKQVVYQPVAQQVTRPIVQPTIQPVTSTEVSDNFSSKVQYCTSCGASNKVEAQYCNTCGSQILHE